MVTAGALGTEESKKKKRGDKKKKDKKSKRRRGEGDSSGKKKRSTVAPAVFSTAPLAPKDNLAGRVDYYIRSDLGVKNHTTKIAKPYHQVNLTTEPFIVFEIRSSKDEFIRFNPESLSLVYYANYANPDQRAGGTAEQKAARHSLRADQAAPTMFMDPSVMGTGFFHRIEVSVDNVPCTSNADLNSLMIQYTRFARIFNDRPPGTYFTTNKDFNLVNKSEALLDGMAPFSASSWNSREGYRMPVYLEGIFPFDLKNRTTESIDRREEQHLYFPPDTCITIKLHAQRTKMESIFHPQLAPNMNEYWDRNARVDNYDDLDLRFTIMDAALAYESVQLHPANHVSLMEAYQAGGLGRYDYDRVIGQHIPLHADLSITETRFQIDPFARLVYIAFLPDYATFNIDGMRRPLSGLSRFPVGCTKMNLSFGSESNLISERLENFGVAGRRVDASKHYYWKKLVDTRVTKCKFEEMFPKSAADYSVIQVLVVDLRNYSSQKVESLVIRMEFAGEAGARSPTNQQVVVFSVHPTGQLQCSLDKVTGRWVWNFGNRTYEGI